MTILIYQIQTSKLMNFIQKVIFLQHNLKFMHLYFLVLMLIQVKKSVINDAKVKNINQNNNKWQLI